MYQSLYVVENSSKNLVRTEGVIGTSLLTGLLAFFSTFSINASLFLHHWYETVSQELASGGLVGMQMLASPLSIIFIFRAITLFVSAALIVSTISYIRRTFIQFANIQRPDFLIMSFIGQTTTIISIEFALQAVYLTTFWFSAGTLIANQVFLKMLTDTAKNNLFAEIIQSFHLSTGAHLLITLLAACYIFIRNFLFVRKYLYSFFDNHFALD